MTTTIKVQNLKCGGCANTITSKLSKVENIHNVQVDVESSSVSFNYASPNEISLVKAKLKKLGYPVDVDVNSISSKAKSFVSCATGKISK